MSERRKPHNGRDLDGDVRLAPRDLEDGMDVMDRAERVVRKAGAVEDRSEHAGEYGQVVQEIIDENREDVQKLAERNRTL